MPNSGKMFTADEVLALIKANSCGKVIYCLGSLVAGVLIGVIGKDKVVSVSGKTLEVLKKAVKKV